MPRKPEGARPLTNAERQRRWRERHKGEPKPRLSRAVLESYDAQVDTLHERVARLDQRNEELENEVLQLKKQAHRLGIEKLNLKRHVEQLKDELEMVKKGRQPSRGQSASSPALTTQDLRLFRLVLHPDNAASTEKRNAALKRFNEIYPTK